MLNPTHLRTLREVLATGSFAEAAARLGYTASAVSQQIAALERNADLELFERNGRSVRPTPEALTIADRAGGILRSLDTLEREVRTLSNNGIGIARIGSFPTANATIMPRALARLRRTCPRVQVQFDEGEPDELLPMLGVGGIDVAVVYEYDAAPQRWPAGLAAVPLVREQLFLLVPDRAERPTGEALQLRDLRNASWVATREDTGGERCLLQLCADAGFSPRIDHRSNDFGVVRGLVAAGLGVAIVPALAVTGTSRIRALPLGDAAPRRNVLALTRTTSVTGLLDPILHALEEAGHELLRQPGVVR